MLQRFLTWLHRRRISRKEGIDLDLFFSRSEARADLLGVSSVRLPSQELVEKDSRSVMEMAQTQGWPVYCREVWSMILRDLVELSKSGNPRERDDFLKGRISTGLELLRIPYKAARFVSSSQSQASASPSRRTQPEGVSK